jgi:O-antigen ligase
LSYPTIRWATPGRLMTLPIVGLAMVLMARGALDIQAEPLKIIAAFLASVVVLVVAARHPAAFVAPVLFLPRLLKVGALDEFGPVGNWTGLQLACILLGAGIMLRWLAAPSHRIADQTSFVPSREMEHAERNKSASGPMLAFLFFAVVVAFSYGYSAGPHYGAWKLIAFTTLGYAMFLTPFVLFTSGDDVRDFTVGTVLFGMLVAASSLSFSATGAMGPQDNPAHIGKGQVIGLAILLLMYTPIRNCWLKAFVLFVCIPALAVGLVSAETRGPLFSLMFVLILALFVESFRSPVITRKQMALVGAALVGSVMLLSTFWLYGAEALKFQYKATEIVSLLENSNEAKGTAVQRLVYYRGAIDLWAERPLFGWGLGGWSMAYRHSDIREYPHNLFLETMVEQGVIGLAALMLFFYSILRHLRACRAQFGQCLPSLLPGFVYLVSLTMFSGDLDDDRFVWFWCGFVLAGSALAACARRQDAHIGDEDSAPDVAVPAAEVSLVAAGPLFSKTP